MRRSRDTSRIATPTFGWFVESGIRFARGLRPDTRQSSRFLGHSGVSVLLAIIYTVLLSPTRARSLRAAGCRPSPAPATLFECLSSLLSPLLQLGLPRVVHPFAFSQFWKTRARVFPGDVEVAPIMGTCCRSTSQSRFSDNRS